SRGVGSPKFIAPSTNGAINSPVGPSGRISVILRVSHPISFWRQKPVADYGLLTPKRRVSYPASRMRGHGHGTTCARRVGEHGTRHARGASPRLARAE